MEGAEIRHSRTYDIHGLIGLEITCNRTGRIGAIDFPLSYFQVDSLANAPDIIVEIGDFEPHLANTLVVDHEFYVGDDYIFWERNRGRARWKVEIFGLESGRVVVRYHSRIRGLEELLIPNYLAHNTVIKPLVDVLMLRKGFAAVHGMAFCTNGVSTVLLGRGGVRKTQFAIDSIKEHPDVKLLGDDWVIIGRDRIVRAFPVLSELLHFKALHLGKEHIEGPLEILRLLNHLAGLRRNEHKTLRLFETKCDLGDIMLLSRVGDGRESDLPWMPAKDAAAFVVNGNKMEMIEGGVSTSLGFVDFLYVMDAYSFVFPHSAIAEHWQRLNDMMLEIFDDRLIQVIGVTNDTTLNDILSARRG